MNDDRVMARLVDVLQKKASAAHAINFWLRDDDAVEPGDALDRLLQLTGTYQVPLTLAVIPAATGQALVKRLSTVSHVSVVVHGWSHANYAADDEKTQELGDHRPLDDVIAELRQGLKRLSDLHGPAFVPLLVPPWNRISTRVVGQLGALGYKAISTFGDERPTAIVSINSQVDIIDWKGTRGGRKATELALEIISHLERGRTTIGILSHHLVHDEAAWQFLERLFETTSAQADVYWRPVSELL